MSQYFRKTLSVAIACAIAAPAFAVEPAVKGPETVADWWNAGQKLIADGKKIVPNAR